MSDITKAIAHAKLLRFLVPRFTAALPVLLMEARHGLAGEFLRLFEPHTEADPAAMLLQFLVGFGSAVGRGPYFEVSGARQRMNLYVMVVGKTSTGRKGTSLEPVVGESWGVIQKASPEWITANGLSSGEGLISTVRDPLGEVEGVEDKRLLVIEPEFAAVFARMKREGNSLSAVIREAWDGKKLRTMTKAEPMSATGAHISIIGNITPKELRNCLAGSVEIANGFGNRFLWCVSERRKSLPVAVELDPNFVTSFSSKVASVIDWASEERALRWTEEAKAAWVAIYDRLTDGPGGALEELAARGSTQVVRLASLYALLDRKTDVGLEHLTAALALWRYTMESCAIVFEANGTGDRHADRVLETIRRAGPGGLSTTDLHRALSNNIKGPQLKTALELLLNRGHIKMTKTSGKKGAHYEATEHDQDAPDGSDASPPEAPLNLSNESTHDIGSQEHAS